MSLMLSLLLGIVLLLVGAHFFVRGAVALARRLGVTPHLIGLTLVAWGGALPELVTGLVAADHGVPALALGSAVGANIANALLAIGLAGVVAPFAPSRMTFERDALALWAAAIALIAACQLPVIDWPTGIAFVALLLVYTAYVFAREHAIPDLAARVRTKAGQTAPATTGGLAIVLIAVGGGIVSMFGGGVLTSQGTKALSVAWGIGDSPIGLTIVALGATLPEIATTAIAVYRRQPDLAIASLIGSSIFNGLGVVGAGAIAGAIAVPADLARLDIWAMAGAMLLLGLIARQGWPIDRREGVGFALGYGLYLLWSYLRAFPSLAPA